MKKSKLLVFLSALLAVMMLFASCGEKDNGDDENNTPPAPEKQVSEDVNHYSSQDVSLWTKYLGYNKPDGVTNIQSYMSLEGKDLHFLNSNNNIIYKNPTTTYSYSLYKPADEENGTPAEYKATRTESLTVYNFELENPEIVKKSVSYDVFAIYSNSEYVVKSAELHVSYRLISITDGIIAIETKTPKKTVDEHEIERLTYVYTYDFMFEDGTVFAEGLESSTVSTGTNNDYYRTVTVDGKVYVFENYDDEVITVFDSVDDVTTLPENNVEYNDYRYFIEFSYGVADYDSQVRIQIVDKAHKIVNDKTILADSIRTCSILDSGDVLVTYAINLLDEAREFDVKYQSSKYELCNVIVKKDGTVAEVETGFVIDELYSAAEETDDFVINGSYNIAYAYDVTEGEISERATVYVLDNNLGVVQKLPNLLLNQNGMAKFIASDRFVIPADNAGDTVYYLINTNKVDGVATKYVDPSRIQYDFGFGFIADGVLYRNDLSVVCDLNETYGEHNWSVKTDSEGIKYILGEVRTPGI